MKKTNQRLWAILLSLMLLFSATPVMGISASAEGATSGTCGYNGGTDVTWSLQNGTLTFSGNGYMTEFSQGATPWESAKPSITAVVLQSGVKSVGNYAFDGCTHLTGVTLPSSVEFIQDYAFRNCIQLASVPTASLSALDAIEDGAFQGCTALTTVTLPSRLRNILKYAFNIASFVENLSFVKWLYSASTRKSGISIPKIPPNDWPE